MKRGSLHYRSRLQQSYCTQHIFTYCTSCHTLLHSSPLRFSAFAQFLTPSEIILVQPQNHRATSEAQMTGRTGTSCRGKRLPEDSHQPPPPQRQTAELLRPSNPTPPSIGGDSPNLTPLPHMPNEALSQKHQRLCH